MVTVGFALFLFIATLNTTNAQKTTLPAQPSFSPDQGTQLVILEGVLPGVSPDPAPPHPLKPRVVPESPNSAIARSVLEAAKRLLRDHGR